MATTDGHLIVDSDAHVTEPADVWTARMSSKLHDQIPRVERHPGDGHHYWRIADHWLVPAAGMSAAGWNDYWPAGPLEYEDCEQAAYDAGARLRRLDDFGIDVQILYPNIIGFYAALIERLGPQVSIGCVRAYNDFALEWCSIDPTRLVPIAMLPFWEVDAAVNELQRCVSLGYRGVLFANKFERMNLPSFIDKHWYPIYAAAQECDVPINYHVGFASFEDLTLDVLTQRRSRGDAERRASALKAASLLHGQADCIGALLCSGICSTFPSVKFVSVETGFGQMPFFLEALDWHWRSYGNDTSMLPSAYFRRQCYGTFWFEGSTLELLEDYPDNFMFSTDYPHPTSLAPGPCGGTLKMPNEWVDMTFDRVPRAIKTKVLSENAQAIYKLDLPPTASAPSPVGEQPG